MTAQSPTIKPSFGKLRAAAAHYGAGPGTPYISDGDSARVLFFFNLSGSYNGNVRIQEAKDDARIIVSRVNNHDDLVAALKRVLEELESRLDLDNQTDDEAAAIEMAGNALALAEQIG